MKSKLEITIEHSWRGSILDTVLPIASLDLIEHESIPGLMNIGDEFHLHLQTGEIVLVWCALTPNKEIKFSLTLGKTEILSLTTERSFYAEARMPDKKLYQFKFKDES